MEKIVRLVKDSKDKDSREILFTNYGYQDLDNEVKTCKYCNEVLIYGSYDYEHGHHEYGCKSYVGKAKRVAEKIRNGEDVDANKSLLISILSYALDSRKIMPSFAKSMDKEFNLRTFC